MKKLKLQLDELTVESFATSEELAAKAGTVHGHISLPSCSCVQCGTDTACQTGYDTGCESQCSKDYPTQEWQLTCLPTCQGYTCDWETCNCTNGC
jgi:hypothetical protein